MINAKFPLYPLTNYHNWQFGYYLDYPSSWQVDEADFENVGFYLGDPEAAVACVSIHAGKKGVLLTFLDVEEFLIRRVRYLDKNHCEFKLKEFSCRCLGYTCRPDRGSEKCVTKEHIVENDGRHYLVIHSCVPEKLKALPEPFLLYDPMDSFRFQPQKLK